MSVNDRNAHSRLAEYRKKRSEASTPEPFPTGIHRPGQFVVHLHAARRRHFDLRLEVGGVLRSWAVPNGPSLDPADKRLAVETEDHPVEYLDFEDVIPEGNYGAGAMIVWDRGRWIEQHDDQTGENKLLFDLYGHKLRGRWTLVRTKRSPKDWLLIKKVDTWVRTGPDAELPPQSVYSGLTVEELAGGRRPAEPLVRQLAERDTPRAALNASSLQLMLARTADAPFSREGWLFEIKYDGYRMVAGIDEGQVMLRYRKGGNATEIYPDLTPALASLPCRSMVLDGEVVVLGGDGRPSFSRLARRARLSGEHEVHAACAESPASYFVFDLLELDGFDLRGLPLHERKAMLAAMLPAQGPVRVAEHIEQRGEAMFEQARRLGLEGLMGKRADAPYRAGRSDAWQKIRVDRTADFVVVGWTRGKQSRESLGALLLAVRHADELVYVGRVGTGFREAEMEKLQEQLAALRLPDSAQNVPAIRFPEPGGPGSSNPPAAADTVWVEPAIVCEVRFKELTEDGMLRHPVFLRQRPDRTADDCASEQGTLRHATVFRPAAEPERPAGSVVAVADRTQITRPEKILWPQDGYTKGDLIDYYRAIADWILPYLEDRPLVLDRYPDGIEGDSFFQKHAPHFTPEWIRTVTVHSGSGKRDIDYFVVEDAEALVYMANAAAIPLHVWSSRVSSLDRPDWTILDLDPKEASFGAVVQVARGIRQLCDQIGLECFVKTSGKTGLHVLVPLGGQVDYQQSRMLADLLAMIVSRRLPEIATVNRALHARGGRVYIDAVQNGAGRLLVSPFCVRPYPGAPVSTPLRWREVGPRLDRSRFTIRTVPTRVRRMKAEPLLPILGVRPDLLGALRRLAEIEKGG